MICTINTKYNTISWVRSEITSQSLKLSLSVINLLRQSNPCLQVPPKKKSPKKKKTIQIFLQYSQVFHFV